MKNLALLVLLIIPFLIPSCSESTASQAGHEVRNDPFKMIEPIPQTYQWLLFGEIKPKGWLLKQMSHDLEKGFTGHLDALVPDLIIADDIYGDDRLTKDVKSKDVGNLEANAAWEVQYLWWNSETQSNWWDGFVRHAILTGNEAALKRARVYVNRMLSYQDKNGYLGIYASDLRYNFDGENGELWAQSTLFRPLLAYYEATGDTAVLHAVERAVNVTMQAYPPDGTGPFFVEESFGGLEHGLTLTDTFDRLYQLTGKSEYMRYALWLYENFSENEISQEDAQYVHLVDSSYRFNTHGVHTYEHLRPLTTAWYASGNENLHEAFKGYMDKLSICLSPSGGPIGDEWIGKRMADASETGYEYCSIHELLDAYSHVLQKTGNLEMADRMEWLLFNAGQGARHPEENAIAYLKTDNSYSMTGPLHPYAQAAERPETRYKYSPVHQDAAVCCAPNAGRIYPYYIKAMWMRSKNGIVAALYGPSEVNTTINGVEVKIEEETAYPFELAAKFKLSVRQPVAFDLSFRKPAWARDIEVTAEGATVTEKDGLMTVSKVWNTNDEIEIKFFTDVKKHKGNNEEYYYSYGPLVYALPLTGEAYITKTYALEGFKDLRYRKASNHNYAVSSSFPALEFRKAAFNPADPWNTALRLTGKLWNVETRSLEAVQLMPLGNTILRRVTFPARDQEGEGALED